MSASLRFVPTPDGPFGILADDDGRVIASGWTDSRDALLARLRPERRPADVRPGGGEHAVSAVDAYYAGEHVVLDSVPVLQAGGPFRTEAWLALRRIAPGRPLTYTEFAAATGRPSAVRAAASACATNAVALFVPCHRVLRTDGSLGGFAWGTEVKRALLVREASAERIQSPSSPLP